MKRRVQPNSGVLLSHPCDCEESCSKNSLLYELLNERAKNIQLQSHKCLWCYGDVFSMTQSEHVERHFRESDNFPRTSFLSWIKGRGEQYKKRKLTDYLKE